MAEQKNPLREWRVSQVPALTTVSTAFRLGLSHRAYLTLEASPDKLCLTTDIILRIARLTRIPLPVLVDWLTETTKEAV